MDFKLIRIHFKTKQNKEIEKKNPFKKNEFESIFSPILLSERNMESIIFTTF